MSINDFMDSEWSIPFIILICLFCFIVIGLKIIKNENRLYNNNGVNSPTIKTTARIVTIKTTPCLTQNNEVNWVMFELADSSRIELAVKDVSAMLEGDFGELSYSGNKFIGFSRMLQQK